MHWEDREHIKSALTEIIGDNLVMPDNRPDGFMKVRKTLIWHLNKSKMFQSCYL